jgi:hypothetical protein
VGITGGTSGLGLATAEYLLGAGARVLVTGHTETSLGTARRKLGGSALSRLDNAEERVCRHDGLASRRRPGHGRCFFLPFGCFTSLARRCLGRSTDRIGDGSGHRRRAAPSVAKAAALCAAAPATARRATGPCRTCRSPLQVGRVDDSLGAVGDSSALLYRQTDFRRSVSAISRKVSRAALGSRMRRQVSQQGRSDGKQRRTGRIPKRSSP